MNEIVVSTELAPPVGFAHAVVADPGKTVYLGGQTAQDASGAIVGSTLVEQFDQACGNVAAALRAAGGAPADLVSLVIYVTDLDGYRGSLKELGRVHQRHFGKHYPAMALFGVTGLLDPAAMVELVGVAVVA